MPSLFFVCKLFASCLQVVCRLFAIDSTHEAHYRPPCGLSNGLSNGCLIYRRPYLYSSALYAIGDPCPRSVCALHIPLKETPQSGKRLQAARGVTFVKQGEIVALSPCNPHYFSGIFSVSVENSAANNCFCRVFCSKIRLFQSVTRCKVALCRRKVALLK